MNFNSFFITDHTIKLNDIVEVTGVSKHGKNRIHEHGNEWRVAVFNGRMNRCGLESTKTKYVRWVDHNVDKDFKVISVKGNIDFKS
jgi:hypothetical protein